MKPSTALKPSPDLRLVLQTKIWVCTEKGERKNIRIFPQICLFFIQLLRINRDLKRLIEKLVLLVTHDNGGRVTSSKANSSNDASVCALVFSGRPLPELQTHGGETAALLPTVNINNHTRRHSGEMKDEGM